MAQSAPQEIPVLPPSNIITLLTDFGNADGYVAAMKGVILSINPAAQPVDLSHEIEAQNITAAELLWSTHFKYFPRGTVHVAIVDPGVGTARSALACAFGGHYFVAPDNGLLDFCSRGNNAAVTINRPKYWRPEVSSTFHGRDIFAPVAAHLTLGVPLSSLGDPVVLVARAPQGTCRIENDKLIGEIIHIDRFGNLISNISYEEFWKFCDRRAFRVQVAQLTFSQLLPSYGYVAAGAPVALFNSFERLEIGINQGRAAAQLNLYTGTAVIVERGDAVLHHAKSRK
ncbi:MAG: SAM hydrolase/SAM-dependent halogenase family protein [bacterium]